ncbi:phosphatase PAP2 family protein [Catellatospora vulcania]|uniref:phosphatase PAP2 family protein n=1 Tax=Catellatospora vulcania TaxID=1460450 RepID=UPI0012D477C2|nr:phosphatase PAP2 family protein [Catellatospora vulcania]
MATLRDTATDRVAHSVLHTGRAGALRPVDAIVLGYLAVVSTLVASGHDLVPHWWTYLIAYAAMACAVLGLIAAQARRPDITVLAVLRVAYPVVLAPLAYSLVGPTVLVVHGGYLDAGMNAFETALWGGHPTLWLDAIVSRPLTELLYACYMSYYLYIVVPPLLLIIRRRLDALERLVTTVSAAVYTCYLGFLILPVLGPRHSLAGQLDPPVLTGYVLAPAQQFLMAHADPAGTCFPSAHVAGAWAAVLAVRRIWGRAAFRCLLLPTVLLTVSVVYTRYHYTADVVAGLAVALAADALVDRTRGRVSGWAGAPR